MGHFCRYLVCQQLRQQRRSTLAAVTARNNATILEVFGDTAKPWTISEVKTKYELMGDHFRLLIFSIDRNIYRLQSLQLVSFNGFDSKGNAHINKRDTIYRAL